MKKQILKIKNQTWTDYSDIQKKDYLTISEVEKFDLATVTEHASHEQLPKFEKDDPYSVLILRVYDDKKKSSADKVQDLTTKIILYFNSENLITIHRISSVK
jgi:magnesium transporter